MPTDIDFELSAEAKLRFPDQNPVKLVHSGDSIPWPVVGDSIVCLYNQREVAFRVTARKFDYRKAPYLLVTITLDFDPDESEPEYPSR